MKRGGIWNVDLGTAAGHKQQGYRPGIIISKANEMTIVIPLTNNSNTLRFSHTHPIIPTRLNGLDRKSVALVFQLTVLSKECFKIKRGILDTKDLEAIEALIKDLLGL